MNFSTDPKTTLPIIENANKLIEELLILLSEKEKFIIQRRFNLDNTSKATLEQIGQKYNVTRERIRQIENNALTKLKRNIQNTQLFIINDLIRDIVKQSGGLISQETLFSKLINYFFSEEKDIIVNKNAIILSASLDPDLSIIQNTINYSPFIYSSKLDFYNIKTISEKIVELLDKRQKVIDIDSIYKEIKKSSEDSVEKRFVDSLLDIDKRVKVIPEGVGLMKWSDVNPKTLSDKILYVLKKNGKPMHFVEIVNSIINYQFDNKRVNTQAVHNELIRQDHFILVGRGLYALKEWGYKKGNVADVIEDILRKNKEMKEEDIINEVLKQRHVKKITIILNLKNKDQFERVGRKVYRLSKKS